MIKQKDIIWLMAIIIGVIVVLGNNADIFAVYSSSWDNEIDCISKLEAKEGSNMECIIACTSEGGLYNLVCDCAEGYVWGGTTCILSGTSTGGNYDFAGYPWEVILDYSDGGSASISSVGGGFNIDAAGGGETGGNGRATVTSAFPLSGKRVTFDAELWVRFVRFDRPGCSGGSTAISRVLSTLGDGRTIYEPKMPVEIYFGVGDPPQVIIDFNGTKTTSPYIGTETLSFSTYGDSYYKGGAYCIGGGTTRITGFTVELSDGDHDGVLVGVDDCPTVAGIPELNGCPALFGIDSDGDGLYDAEEVRYNLDLNFNDSWMDLDNDTISTLDEVIMGTNPLSDDTDGDGVLDNVDDCPTQPAATSTGCVTTAQPVIQLFREVYTYTPASRSGMLVPSGLQADEPDVPWRRIMFFTLIAYFIHLTYTAKLKGGKRK